MKYWILICCFLLNLNLSSQDKVAVCDMDMMVAKVNAQIINLDRNYTKCDSYLVLLDSFVADFYEEQYVECTKLYSNYCGGSYIFDQMVDYMESLETDLFAICRKIENFKLFIDDYIFQQSGKLIKTTMVEVSEQLGFNILLDTKTLLYRKDGIPDISQNILNDIKPEQLQLDLKPIKEELERIESCIGDLMTFDEYLKL